MAHNLEELNLNELYLKINSIVGENLGWEAEIKTTYRGTDYLYIESIDIKDKAGIMSRVYKNLCLATFNSSFSIDEDSDHIVWMTVNFKFNYLTGGSNGCDFLTCYLMKDGHWKIKDNSKDY